MNLWHRVNPANIKPEKFLACIEIPQGSKNKYELDKYSGALKLDRILYTSTHYPHNYGFIPKTLADDGDPLDCVVVCNAPLMAGVLIEVRPIGVLIMEDQAGGDEKVICVPLDRIDPYYKDTNFVEELPAILRSKIEYFFQIICLLNLYQQ